MKKVILAVLLLIGVTGAMAQEVYNSSGKTNYKKKKKTGYDADKLVIGGGVNLGFGTGFASLGASPMVGYKVLKPLAVGVGVGYLYQKGNGRVDLYNNIHYQYFHVVYPSLWARCFVYRNIYAIAAYEYDFINVRYPEMDYNGNMVQKRANVTNQCALIGAGWKQAISGRVSFYGELVYDVLQGQYSPYTSNFPDFRIGIVAGL